MSLELHEIVPWGRTRAEYERMFCFGPEDFQKTILGCGDGPASFNAEMTASGHDIVSFDPIYEFSIDQIQSRFEAIKKRMRAMVRENPDRWSWTFHQGPDDLLRHRERAFALFRDDFPKGQANGRYVAAALPSLPFGDGHFDLAVCSHLLFLYSDLLDERFHRKALHELTRVAAEVRIFPLLTLEQDRSPYIEAVVAEAEQLGCACSIEVTEYELQKGGNQMMRVRRK